ncbi:MAG: CDP-glycerol glycerophosphotransferase family protein [Pseudomonadota bacterium]
MPVFEKKTNTLVSYVRTLPYFLLSGIIAMLFAPKRNRIVFCSNSGEGLTGNAKFLFEYMRKDARYECHYLFRDPRVYEHYKKSYSEAIYAYSWRGLWLAARARIFVVTHSRLDVPVSLLRKVCIQTWHGIPIKPLGFLKHGTLRKRIRNHVYKWIDYDLPNYYLSSSRYVSQLLAGTFRQPLEKFVEAGFPRDDALIHGDRAGIRKKVVRSLGLDESAKLILYAPTWRDYAFEYFGFPHYAPQQVAEFHATLLANNAYLLLKSHRNGPLQLPGELKSERLIDMDLGVVDDVQELLLASDYLITDYSSICLDGLILNLPMLFIVSDRERYENRTGPFCCDYELMATGPKVSTLDGFNLELKKILSGDDAYGAQRDFVSGLLRSPQGELSCPRVTRFIDTLLGGRSDK